MRASEAKRLTDIQKGVGPTTEEVLKRIKKCIEAHRYEYHIHFSRGEDLTDQSVQELRDLGYEVFRGRYTIMIAWLEAIEPTQVNE